VDQQKSKRDLKKIRRHQMIDKTHNPIIGVIFDEMGVEEVVAP